MDILSLRVVFLFDLIIFLDLKNEKLSDLISYLSSILTKVSLFEIINSNFLLYSILSLLILILLFVSIITTFPIKISFLEILNN